MTRLRVVAAVREELRRSALWYDQKRRGLGRELIDAVDTALERVRSQPESAPLWRPDRPYRVIHLRRFPYSIFFRIRERDVEVVAFAHQKRRPGYWTER
ncbi:MAG: type II toxin-antitoxin system RelE/ParE family toxin [Deltaproteobacteria bacterium]|nr:type II toxin-antitoxin system RelE/ParE family toxin [Nannocystaceae bacterium]